MASAYEVRQVAVKVKNLYNEMDRRRSKLNSEAKDSIYWWKGAANDKFLQEYKKTNDDIHALIDALVELEKNLRAVANAIVEAEALAE